MHAVKYGITEIQNSAGDLKKKTNHTLIHVLGERSVHGLIKNRLDSDPTSI